MDCAVGLAAKGLPAGMGDRVSCQQGRQATGPVRAASHDLLQRRCAHQTPLASERGRRVVGGGPVIGVTGYACTIPKWCCF